jgi:hypothetical protein
MLSHDFISHRISDACAAVSLLALFKNYELLLYISMILRLVPTFSNGFKYDREFIFNYFLPMMYIKIGALLFIIKTHKLYIYDSKLYLASIFIFGIIIIYQNFRHKNIIYILYYLIGASLLTLYTQNIFIAHILIITILISAPILILITASKKRSAQKVAENTFLPRLIKNFVKWAAEFSTRFMNIFYAHFLFYKVPQIILGFLLVPLRIFYTGSFQRSVAFILILLLSYYWMWR